MPIRNEQKETALERKLKEIERERRRVEQELKQLNKSVRKGSGFVSKGASPSLSAGEPPENIESTIEDYAGEKKARVPGSSPSEKLSGTVLEKRAPIRGDERFANYFSTGGLKTPISSRRMTPTVERNKSVFLVMVFLLVSYIIYVAFIR